LSQIVEPALQGGNLLLEPRDALGQRMFAMAAPPPLSA
jgi:hypothetical protein